MAGSRKVVVDTTKSNNMMYLPLDPTAQTNTGDKNAAAAAAQALPTLSTNAPDKPKDSNAPQTAPTPPATGDANDAARPPRVETSTMREGR